ncbi:MAG: hypothetical protein ACRDNW_16735, partial [Trebonia sp.]
MPPQGAQPVDALGEEVVVDDALVFGSVLPDDVVVVQVLEFRPVPRSRSGMVQAHKSNPSPTRYPYGVFT